MAAPADAAHSATLFCRVSSKQQASNYSPEAQQRLGYEYAARHGLTITRVFQVVETATKKAARAKWREYLDYVRRGPEAHALIATVDRALRNYADLPEIAELRKKYGKTVHFFLEGLTLDGSHAPTANLRLGIQTAVAVWYAGEMAEKTRRGQDEKARRGGWPNRSCYGYKTNKKRLVIDPERARWVRRIKELAAEGRHSLARISELLFAEGCTLYGKKLHTSFIERVIRKPIYAGRFEWPARSGNWIQGTHEPIVPWDLHEAAVAGLERKDRPRYRKHQFTFAGMIRCGCCPQGRAVVFEIKKDRYVYGHCTGARRLRGGPRLCPDAEFVPLDTIERQAKAALASVQISYELAEKIYASLAEEGGAAQGEAETGAALLRQQLKRLEERMSRAYVDKLDGKIDESFWRDQQRRWGEEKIRIEEALKRQQAAAPNAVLRHAKQVLELAKDIVGAYEFASVDEKRRILNLVCSNFSLKGKKLDYIMKKSFGEVAEGLLLGNWWRVGDSNPWSLP